MDPRAFDALIGSLAAPRSRRGFLGGLAALGAGLLAGRGADAQVTLAYCGNQTCKNKPGRCQEGCVCCVWSNGNNRCVPPGQCTAGGVVVGGTTTAPPTTTTPTPTTTTPTTQAPTTTSTTGSAGMRWPLQQLPRRMRVHHGVPRFGGGDLVSPSEKRRHRRMPHGPGRL